MKKLTACIAVILLQTLLVSCVCGKVEYIEKPYVPEITFPAFPILDGGSENADGSVNVPAEWILRLAEYKILIEETEKNYNEIKELYKQDYSRE